MAADYDLLTGKDVYSAEGDKVGTVKGVYRPAGDFAAGVGRHYFLLDPGLLRDWFGGYDEVYLPESAIGLVTTERVDLHLTKDQIKGQDWTTRPADLDTYLPLVLAATIADRITAGPAVRRTGGPHERGHTMYIGGGAVLLILIILLLILVF